jgi:hypothetical protein
MSAIGGTGAVAITTQPECTWTASADAPWIGELGPAQGQGNGQVQFQVATNPTGTSREGTVTVNGEKAAIRQDAAACRFDVSVSSTSFPATGGSGTSTVTGPGGCAWTATSSAIWITVLSAGGTGSGIVGFAVSTNTGPARTGTLEVGGATLTIAQASGAPGACSISLQPTSVSTPAGGGVATVTVTAGFGCPWTAVSNVPWLTITAGGGNGNGTVTLNVAPNSGSARSGTATIAGQTFTVNQAGAGPCTYSISPTAQTVGSDAGSGNPVTVTAPAGCTWTSTANANWLQITSGSSGTGNGAVTFTFTNFTGASRTGTLTIAGRTFTVIQVKCTATLSPANQSVSAAGGALSVSLTTQDGCGWTASSNVAWISITNGTSGTGSKTVNYLVVPNPGGNRTGRLTFVLSTGDEKLTIDQARN